MKGVGRLIKNELVKVIHRTGWKVITIILLSFAILGPGITNLASNVFNDLGIGGLIGAFEYEGMPEAEREYYNVIKDTDKFFAEQNIDTSHWKYETYYYNYYHSAMNVKAFELVKNGEDPIDVFMIFENDYVDFAYAADGSVSGVMYYPDGNYEGEGVLFTKELAEALYPYAKESFETIKDQVVNSSVSTLADMYVPLLETEISSVKDKLASTEEKYKTNKSVMQEYLGVKYDLEVLESALSIYKSMKDAKPEDETWLIKTAELVTGQRNKAAEIAAVDKESFAKDTTLIKTYRDYENYTDRMNIQYETFHEALEVLKYSAAKKIPVPEVLDTSVRSNVASSVDNAFSIVMLFSMILAATILSSEYSSGSIRLLLIRPRARWKILLSKMAAVVIYAATVFIAMSILTSMTHFILDGFGDFGVPYLEYSGGSVREINSVVHILLGAVVSSLPDILLVAFALMLSIVLRKAVFAITIPVFIYITGSIATTIMYSLIPKYGFLRYTILPYLNIEELMYSDVYNAFYSFSIFGFTNPISIGLTAGIAAIILLLHIAIITVISFVVFRRQQIKN